MITTVNEFRKINETKQQLDLAKLQNELEIFRKDMEDRNEFMVD